uniref:Exonuclease domain-containing protein n=1 Tax=Spermophilus dauricus TaxID=99837 RepID=A0A8C9QS35_SPEDA
MLQKFIMVLFIIAKAWSRRQFGSRGVREGGAAMAAGESMAQRMVWVDLEMTGLDIEKDQIIEMACLITDSDLNILAEGP